MLIVGDLPYKLDIDNSFDVQAIEVIVAPEKMERLFEELKIKNERGVTLGKDVKMYMQNGHKYIIMTANNAYLRILIAQNFAMNTLRIATPAVNYSYLWFYNYMRRYDPTGWLKIAKQTNGLKEHFYYTYRHKTNQFKLLKCGERLIGHHFRNLSYFKEPYKRMGFIKYDKYALLVAIGSVLQSPYKRCTIPGPLEFFQKPLFNSFSPHEKKITILEMLYLYVISEIFIAEMFISNKYPDTMKWKFHFVEAMMDIVTSDRNDIDFIKDYILDNIDDLVISFRPELIQNFIDAEKRGELVPLKSWKE